MVGLKTSSFKLLKSIQITSSQYIKHSEGAQEALTSVTPKPLKSTLMNEWTCKFMFSSVFQENELKVQIDKPCKR